MMNELRALFPPYSIYSIELQIDLVFLHWGTFALNGLIGTAVP